MSAPPREPTGRSQWLGTTDLRRCAGSDDTEPLPLDAPSFDLLVSFYAGPASLLHGVPARRRLLLANPSHGDVALASVDPRYELTGVMHSRDGGCHYASAELES
jgi:hypothetical protein